MVASSTPRFTPEQIGRIAVRFPSGAPIPTAGDMATDPYAATRVPKEQVEGLMFWPQEKAQYPAVVLLHDWWGLDAQAKDLSIRLACEGYTVLAPNVYGRQGGMVTVNAEVAEALAARVKEPEVLQDLTACCDFLNMRDHVKRNTFAVVGWGLGGWLTLAFACRRKRLRGAVSFYGKLLVDREVLGELSCPVLYHHAGRDPVVSDEEVEQFERTVSELGKQVEVRRYPDVDRGFCDPSRPVVYRGDAAGQAWQTTTTFLARCFGSPRS